MKIIKNLFLILLCLTLLVACSSKETNNQSTREATSLSYENFKDNYIAFEDKFKPKDFLNISSKTLVIKTTSFPDNKIDTRQVDIIDNDTLKPARYELYYRCNDNENIIAKVNFIYFPDSNKSQFVTINSLSPLSKSNISDEYQTISLPIIDDYLMSFNGYLVLINFIDISNDNITDEYYHEFILTTLNFYNEFEKTILSVDSEINE